MIKGIAFWQGIVPTPPNSGPVEGGEITLIFPPPFNTWESYTITNPATNADNMSVTFPDVSPYNPGGPQTVGPIAPGANAGFSYQAPGYAHVKEVDGTWIAGAQSGNIHLTLDGS